MENANYIQKLQAKPQNIFLLDALGATLTALLIFGVLIPCQTYFGIPKNTLLILAVIATCFCFYSFCCFFFNVIKYRVQFLLIIIIANSAYALLSVIFIFIHSQQITTLGITYLIAELIVLAIVIKIESKIYAYLNS